MRKTYSTTPNPLAALSYAWIQHHWIWDLHLKLSKTMSMNEAKDIDRLPITFTGQAYNHHSKEPSLNQLYALPRELSTWFVLGLPPLR